MIRPEDVSIEATSRGVRIHVADDATDSLAVIEVSNVYGNVGLRGGLRGNFDADKRPMRWISTSMEAPPVTARERLERFWAYVKRRHVNTDEDSIQRLLSRLEVAARAEDR